MKRRRLRFGKGFRVARVNKRDGNELPAGKPAEEGR